MRVLVQQPLQEPVEREAREKIQALVLHAGHNIVFFFIILFVSSWKSEVNQKTTKMK